MQLPPQDELVLVSGMAPIRAQKLRYYEDRHFARRRLPPPLLSDGPYSDAPAFRANEWANLVRRPDARLAAGIEDRTAQADGGLEQQRHPALEEGSSKTAEVPEPDGPEPDRDDGDLASDKRVMDRVRGTLLRGHALNQGQAQDLLPGL